MTLIDTDIKMRLKDLYDRGRAYHNWDHVQALLALLDEFQHLVVDQEAVSAAIYFHDAIYDSRDNDNEERSASLALDWLQTKTTSKRLSTIAAAILATKKHVLPEGLSATSATDIQFILDADLSILGTDPETFEAYDAAIRTEYAWVDDAAWKAGRGFVLQRFLDRPLIFQLPALRDRYEAKARRNLEAAIAKLKP
jgi:predicted metal-dependent HD superfamily phosphohydrolase